MSIYIGFYKHNDQNTEKVYIIKNMAPADQGGEDSPEFALVASSNALASDMFNAMEAWCKDSDLIKYGTLFNFIKDKTFSSRSNISVMQGLHNCGALKVVPTSKVYIEHKDTNKNTTRTQLLEINKHVVQQQNKINDTPVIEGTQQSDSIIGDMIGVPAQEPAKEMVTESSEPSAVQTSTQVEPTVDSQLEMMKQLVETQASIINSLNALNDTMVDMKDSLPKKRAPRKTTKSDS